MIKHKVVQVTLVSLLLSSAAHAGVPRLTASIGFLMAGFVTGNQAWDAYKSSSGNLAKAAHAVDHLLNNGQPKPVPHIHDKVDPYMKNPLAVTVYNYYLNHPEACQYGAASAVCLGIGVHLLHKEFKGKKHHHHRHNDD
jgi:hypothetical protein